MIEEANLLSNLDRDQQAYELLLNISGRMLRSSNLSLLRQYYFVKTMVSEHLGNYRKALKYCTKAIGFNNQLGYTGNQQYRLHELQAKIYYLLGQPEECLKVHSGLFSMLLVNGRPESY